jgi:tRNA(Ser,Leu) C12 N-acetylase TAN1
MNLYPQEELDRINKIKETNDKLEEFFNDKREEWTKAVDPLFDVIKSNFTLESFSKVVDSQATSLSYRQKINEQISFFLNKRSKEEVKLKKVKQDKFMFYALGVGLKTSLGEKNTLIDAHISENERNIQLIENYIEFLRSTSKNLESLGYTIKNIIELMNYLGR